MKEKNIFTGIDISKLTLDICLLRDQKADCVQIKNQVKIIRSFFKRLKTENKDFSLFICMESTGYYNWPLYEALQGLELNLYVVNPLHLKKSMGLTRGKSDSIDAVRIAKFISVHHSNLKPSVIARKQIRVMQALVAHRARLIQIRTKLSVPTAELAFVGDKQLLGQIKKSSSKLIKKIETEVKNVEDQLNKLVDRDVELSEKSKYIGSVQGVGKVLTWTILIKTNEFKSINDPKKLACYAGVVPFEHKSGISINRKPRVSNMADKNLKKLLHMAAMRAIQLHGELKNYYLRKVGEGKNKMLVLNAVRNKIVARICSVVNNKKNYKADLLLS